MQNKTLLSLATAFAFGMLTLSNPADAFAQAPQKQKQAVAQSKAKKQTAEFKITGMTCGACSSKVSKAVKNMPGILTANVSHDKGNAIVEFDKSKTNMEALKKAIVASGFKVAEAKVKQ